MLLDNQNRPSWDEYFLSMAKFVATRSTCLRRHIGAIATKEHRIIATGYNGHMIGSPHCMTCMREVLGVPSGQRSELCKVIHAEMNIMAQCAYYGISLKDSTIYVTNKPCSMCLKNMIQAGVIEIIYENNYPDELTDTLIKEANFRVEHKDNNLLVIRK